MRNDMYRAFLKADTTPKIKKVIMDSLFELTYECSYRKAKELDYKIEAHSWGPGTYHETVIMPGYQNILKTLEKEHGITWEDLQAEAVEIMKTDALPELREQLKGNQESLKNRQKDVKRLTKQIKGLENL